MIVLKRQLYSIVEEQKDYSILSDLVKKGRNKLSDFVGGIANDVLGKRAKIVTAYKDLEKNQKSNKELTNRLINEIEKDKVKVFKNNRLKEIEEGVTRKNRNKMNVEKETFVATKRPDDPIFDQSIRENIVRYNNPKLDPEYKEAVDAINEGKYLINLGEDTDKAAINLAHEYGHIVNRKKKLDDAISRTAEKYKPKKGGNNSLKKLIGHRIFQPIEESNAWKNGKKVFKKAGATKEELVNYKDRSRLAIKEYKRDGEYKILRKISDKIRKD